MKHIGASHHHCKTLTKLALKNVLTIYREAKGTKREKEDACWAVGVFGWLGFFLFFFFLFLADFIWKQPNSLLLLKGKLTEHWGHRKRLLKVVLELGTTFYQVLWPKHSELQLKPCHKKKCCLHTALKRDISIRQLLSSPGRTPAQTLLQVKGWHFIHFKRCRGMAQEIIIPCTSFGCPAPLRMELLHNSKQLGRDAAANSLLWQIKPVQNF